jgi:hypothetical protein
MDEEEELCPTTERFIPVTYPLIPQEETRQPKRTEKSEQLINPMFCPERDSTGRQISEESLEHLEAIEKENQRNSVLLQIRGIPPKKVKNDAKHLPKRLPSRLVSVKPSEIIDRYYTIQAWSPEHAKRIEDDKKDLKLHAIRCTGAQFADELEPSNFNFELDYWIQPILEPIYLPPIYDDQRPPRSSILPVQVVERVELYRPPSTGQNIWMTSAYPIDLKKVDTTDSREEDDDDSDDEDLIQETNTAESHNLQSSEGQLRMPHQIAKVEVIAALTLPEWVCNPVLARSDDPLALKAEKQPESDLSRKVEVQSCLNEELGPDYMVQKSESHPNCALVRPVNPESPPDSPTLLKYKERQREMSEIKHFLNSEFVFKGLEAGLCGFPPGPSPDRDKWLDSFFHNLYRFHDFKGDQCLFQARVRTACQFIALWDEDGQDEVGTAEFQAEQARDWKSCHFDPIRGWVQHAYNLGQCERTNGPSHVEDGGGDALEPAPLCCEQPLGPSRYTGDATQRSSDDDQDMDRSSPVQSVTMLTLARRDFHELFFRLNWQVRPFMREYCRVQSD